MFFGEFFRCQYIYIMYILHSCVIGKSMTVNIIYSYTQDPYNVQLYVMVINIENFNLNTINYFVQIALPKNNLSS